MADINHCPSTRMTYSTQANTNAYDAEMVEQLLEQAVSEADFMAIPLKHCPFCGPGNSIASLWLDDVARRWRVGCGACGASTGIHPRDKTPRAAIEAWNRRG